jgi:hypothetical protein
MIVTKYLSDGYINAVKRSQDCTSIVEYTKAMHNAGAFGNDYKHCMKAPAVLVEKYCNDRGITFADFMEDEAHVKAFVENPDHSMLRIWTGRM